MVSSGDCTVRAATELGSAGMGGQECPPYTLLSSYSQARRPAGSKRSICASRWLVRRPSAVFPYCSSPGSSRERCAYRPRPQCPGLLEDGLRVGEPRRFRSPRGIYPKDRALPVEASRPPAKRRLSQLPRQPPLDRGRRGESAASHASPQTAASRSSWRQRLGRRLLRSFRRCVASVAASVAEESSLADKWNVRMARYESSGDKSSGRCGRSIRCRRCCVGACRWLERWIVEGASSRLGCRRARSSSARLSRADCAAYSVVDGLGLFLCDRFLCSCPCNR